ncbi:MAG TPA: hypothetical protein PLS53_13455 [Thermoanaerobaculaceae bacterium]|nr:hypothetical protein [Thermoanaerobaculaceae bacterium]HPS79159.1 hypothetical protein [Thermoanaerobaculaceae bacterium]
MRLDSTWHHVSSKVLRSQTWCPEGVAYWGDHSFVSFLDSS